MRRAPRPSRQPLVRTLVLLTLVVAAVAAGAQAPAAPRGFIWSVERDGRTSWLVGSLHVLSREMYPLPAAMDQAFTRARTLIEEADVNDLTSPELMAAVATKSLFTNGQTLDAVLPAPAYAQLSQRVATTGLPIDMVRLMRPWMAELTISALELQAAGFDPELGIDVHYRRRAAEQNLPVSMLETAAEQIGYLADQPLDAQVTQLQKTLAGGDTELKEVRQIAAAWRAGDAAAIERLLIEGMKVEAPASYQTLLVERNRRWIPRIETCLSTGGCFIVVGAAHMVGSDGLIATLRAKGYRITQQ